MNKTLAIIALCAAAGIASPALAGSSANNNASPSGAVHGAFADVNGNFGSLGSVGGTPGAHGAVGQEQGATGYNNSTANGNTPPPAGTAPSTPPPPTQ